ncbi:hypothetical protein BST61_g1920 [Cercospora zeina]
MECLEIWSVLSDVFVVSASKKRRFTSAIITVAVGQGELPVEFHVHEDLLREHSGFFEAALNGQWKEAQERKIKLPEDNPDVVDVYVQWLYGGKIEAAVPEAARHSGWMRSVFWAYLYVFSDKIQDLSFANAVMEAWTMYIDEPRAGSKRIYSSLDCVEVIYEHTASGSPARQFLVHVWTTCGRSGWFDVDGCEAGLLQYPEFLLDLARAYTPKSRTGGHQSLYETREKWLHRV